MKFGNIYWQNTCTKDNEVMMVNIGDNLQFMTIDYLYSRLKIDTNDVVRVRMDELKNYQGEELLLPLNWALFDPFFMNENRIAISDKIIPLFLGVTIESYSHKEAYFNDYNIAYLRRYEPIGCRDEYTVSILRKHHVRAYLNGCMTSILPKRRQMNQDKIFFVDVPTDLQQYIPDEIKGEYEVLTQQYYFNRDTSIASILDIIKAQYYKYADEARLVVTSRLHVASPCMAMGIPVIFVKNQIDARFGWLDKYIPLYDKEHYSQIDWAPKSVEYEESKKIIIQNAINRIKGTYEKYAMANSVDLLYENRCKRKYVGFQQTIYDNFEKAIIFLRDNYEQEDKFIYSIWGINNAAENFYKYMNQEYPNAKLKNVIDSYKKTEFHGNDSIKPEDFAREDNEVIFVLPVKASNEAARLFTKKGIDSKYYVCCGDLFIGFED